MRTSKNIIYYFLTILAILSVVFILRILLFIFLIETLYIPYHYYYSPDIHNNTTSASIYNVNNNAAGGSIEVGSMTTTTTMNHDYLSITAKIKDTTTISSSSVNDWNKILSNQKKEGLNILDDYTNDETQMCNAAYQKVCSIYEYDIPHHLQTLNDSEIKFYMDNPILLSSGTFKDISDSIEATKNNIIMNIHNGEPFETCVEFFQSMLPLSFTSSSSSSSSSSTQLSNDNRIKFFFNDDIYWFYLNYIEEFNIKTMYDVLLHTNAHSLLLMEHRVKRMFKSEYVIELDLNINLIDSILFPLLTSFNSTFNPDFYNFVFDSIYDLIKLYINDIDIDNNNNINLQTNIQSKERDCINLNSEVVEEDKDKDDVQCLFYFSIKELQENNYDCLVKKLKELWNVSDFDLISFNNYDIKIFESMFCNPLSLNTTVFLLGLDYIVPAYTIHNYKTDEVSFNNKAITYNPQKYNSLLKKQKAIYEKTKKSFINIITRGNLILKFKKKFINNHDHDKQTVFHKKSSNILKELLNFTSIIKSNKKLTITNDIISYVNERIKKKCKKTIRGLFPYTFNYQYMQISTTSNNQCENVFELIQKYINTSKSFFTPNGEFINFQETSLFTKAEIEDISLKNTKNDELNQKFYAFIREKMKHLMIIVLNCIDIPFAFKLAKEEYSLKEDLNISKITSKKTKWLLYLHIHRLNWMDRIIDLFVKSTHRYDYLKERESHMSFLYGRGSQILRWIWCTTEVEIVNAWYTPTMNMITIPIGIIEYPLFRNDLIYDDSLLGNIVGHEIGHASDNHGILFDSYGNYHSKFKERINTAESCLADDFPHKICEYDNYGNHTLGENMADQFGLRMTLLIFYQRITADYLSSIAKDYNVIDDNDDKKNHIPKYNEINIQLYKHRKNVLQKELFINFIKIWCGRTTIRQECNLVNHDVHALARHRVTNTLRNFKTYKQLFECSIDDPLVNPKPCLIY